MTVSSTIQLLAPYVEQVDEPLLLSSFFTVPQGGIHNRKQAEFHIQRSNRKVAVPMRSDQTGYHMNGLKSFTKVLIDPANYKEGVSVSANEVMEGQTIGMTVYENPTIMEQIRLKVEPTIIEVQEMIRRGMELYAAQVFLNPGSITLTDTSGATIFSESFDQDTDLYTTASVAWATSATAVPFTDIDNVCQKIATKAKRQARRGICNSVLFNTLKTTTQFKNGASKEYTGEIYRLDQSMDPIWPRLNNGAVFRGVLRINTIQLDLYTYDAEYDHPQTGTSTKYIPNNKFIVESGGRLDATFGRLNKFGMDPEAARLVRTGRVSSAAKLADLTYNMWFSADYEVFNFGCGSRIALAPVAPDTIGVITTTTS